ncbi:hydantoinase B/oxoprolinase family protein [Sabulicella glaciei]|uniref:Hydantoinase B/oxoprolinase family protein n=1 Tax=Sabulicella glaciei TaxID=2984948 RepID=A0ABT3NPD5_9PROT|nr:hydantoinase B/oxoprolinase family protein [Roseococcus sp. MDT2-1-1]MCW8084026.1 hydantoinase B/oxoprolinase family protein [Roseococcus sp. MDT2-1-1]
MNAFAIDPIRLAVIQKQVDHISQQMGWIMTRTARSPIFSQSHDFTCFVAGAGGDIIAQADGIPIHSGGGGFAVRAALRDFAEEMAEGDVYLLSDPYTAGGNHLPDWTMIRPVFVEGRLCAFTCNRAHQSDIGGGAAGTYNPEATEIFHEGIRLPVLRLVEAGKLRRDLFNLLLLNSRCPDLMEGDLSAMFGSTRIGAERVAAMLSEMEVERGLAYFDALLRYGEARMRAEIAKLPNGTYLGEDGSDTDCFQAVEVPVRVSLEIRDDALVFDFTGSAPQIRGFKNSSLANTYSAVYVAVATFFDHSLPRNEGLFRPVSIIAPEGTVVNARPPAPMTMNTVYPATDIIYACWKALAQAAPERGCAGWGKACYGLSSGLDAEGRFFVMYHWHGASGGGAVKGRDGFASVGHMISLGGLTLPNVEGYEQAYPVRIHRQELRCDTAGAGEFRGGAGVDYVCDVLATTEHAIRAEGVRRPSGYGINGGMDGAAGQLEVEELGKGPCPPPQYGIQRLGPSRIRVLSSAGGGWGDPLRRDPETVLADVMDGIISEEAARDLYGVVLERDGRAVDHEQTALRRGSATRA